MKKTLVFLALLAALSLPMVAGPTLGVGIGWYPNQAWIAPSFGLQWLAPIGVETNVHFARLYLETGDDFEFALAGFWEILTITGQVIGPVRGVFGVGTPFELQADEDNFGIGGGDLGWLFGFSIEGDGGSGFKALAWWNGASLGVGATVYVDLFPAPEPELE